MRKATELQEEVMEKGIQLDAIPKSYNIPQAPSEYSSSTENPLPGYGQVMLEGQMQTDDETLRDRIRALSPGEVLILRGDKHNSLA